MNILYLHSHDTGRHIEPYGYRVHTPHLQRLADSGVLFRDAHCAGPTCSPSRAALLTGQCAHAAGMVALAHRGGRVLRPERHLAAFLAGHGYDSVLGGLSHVGRVEDMGYTRIGNRDWKDSDATVAFCREFLKADGSKKPFFLDAGFVETHRTEWVCNGFNQEHHSPKDGEGNPDYLQPPPPLPDTPQTRRDWLDYLHSVERLDSHYGAILAALDEAGLTENTLVLATTDHGIAFPDHKCKLTAHGTGVLFILRAPKDIPPGKVSDALVSHLDFYPTLCELAGLPQPEWLEGKSLLPLIRGDVDVLHEEIFSEVTFHAAFEPKRSVRTKRWNYIRNFDAPRTEAMNNCDEGHSKELWIEHGMAGRTVPTDELYDLMFDPQERCNLADNPGLAEVKTGLRERLRVWMTATADPLLDAEPAALPERLVVDTDPIRCGVSKQDWNPAQWQEIDHCV